MIYRVFSNHNIQDPRIINAIESWNRNDIINIPINDLDLKRNINGLPYFKDILDIGYAKCINDDDIILYTNTDIGLITDFDTFPNENFFSVRKNVSEIKKYNKSELENIKYQPVLCCDLFGITKKWYKENKDNIPDFIIGSPSWDIAFLFITDGIRIDNISFHTLHGRTEWQLNLNQPFHSYNKKLFYDFLARKGHNVDNIENIKKGQLTKIPLEILNYLKKHKGFNYLHY
jgi:hypothetical protein